MQNIPHCRKLQQYGLGQMNFKNGTVQQQMRWWRRGWRWIASTVRYYCLECLYIYIYIYIYIYFVYNVFLSFEVRIMHLKKLQCFGLLLFMIWLPSLWDSLWIYIQIVFEILFIYQLLWNISVRIWGYARLISLTKSV